MRILHAALPDDWGSARRSGSYAVSTRGRRLDEEGFIHASTRAQATGVLDAFYADVPGVVLLVLDVDRLTAAGSPVRWDDVPGAPGPFPHVYGPIPVPAAVVASIDVAHRAGQPWELPDLSAYDVT
jgi:uncharacterized protein (DUF952 family)